MLKYSLYPDSETHRDLKEKLYYTMIEYFNKGKVCCKDYSYCIIPNKGTGAIARSYLIV